MHDALARTMIDDSDQALVLRAQRGDRHAFSQLVQRYQNRIYGLCFRLVGRHASAEEVAQEVFVRAWRGLSRFRHDASFTTWLRRIAVNTAANHRDARTRRGWGKHTSIDHTSTERPRPLLEVLDGGSDSASRTHQREARQVVDNALASLEPAHREVLVLRELEDLDYDEIAELLDLQVGTVKSRLHRARVRFAALVRSAITPTDVGIP
ncbi:MAG: RNA polymerase sigma factor [Myxococcota bacterium]